ncbi:hypothetical protein F8M41_014205 [Gigaspora margarita]|uniref:Uncharacterized protein n=1 Tax=Gigaspora margarita TaxID=4874 RepID=A0A8H4B3J0_GIGMA|nr:hypothetical protein F8M41_014205 [Gigaspora margarita]
MDSFVDLGKDKSTKEKNEISKSRDLAEMDDMSCEVIDEFDLKKEEKVEALPMKPKKIVDDETLKFLLGIIEEYSCLIAYQDCPSEAREEEALDLDVDLTEPAIIKILDAYYALDKPVQELLDDTGKKEPTQELRGEISTKKGKEKNYKVIVDNVKVLTEKEKLDHACELWLKKVTKFRETVRDEYGTIRRLIRINEESTKGLVKFSSRRGRGFTWEDLKEETGDADKTYTDIVEPY